MVLVGRLVVVEGDEGYLFLSLYVQRVKTAILVGCLVVVEGNEGCF